MSHSQKMKRLNRFRKLNILTTMKKIQSHHEVVHPVRLERQLNQDEMKRKTKSNHPDSIFMKNKNKTRKKIEEEEKGYTNI